MEAAQNPRNHRYSLSRGIPKLRQEITKRYKRNYGVDLDPESEAIVTIGAKDALAHLLFAVIGPGDEVVSAESRLSDPPVGRHYGRRAFCACSKCQTRTRYSITSKTVYRRSYTPPRAVADFRFPHNPTTHCVDLNFFKEVIRLASHYGSMVIHDFAYADLCFDDYRAPSMLQVEGAKEVGVEIFSMSKSYNMAGWRVGFCLGNRKMIAALARIKSYLDYGVFQPIQIASIIALRECEEETKKICQNYQKRRDVLVSGLCGAGWPVQPPKATMFLWAPIPEPFRAMGSLEFSKALLQKALTAVSPGVGFGPMGEGYVRFSLIENEHRTRQSMRSVKQFLKGSD